MPQDPRLIEKVRSAKEELTAWALAEGILKHGDQIGLFWWIEMISSDLLPQKKME